MKRIIFHIDVNNAFLSWTAVDLLKKGYKKDIRTIPSIIGGDESKRHGIVLAKSPIAKRIGITTAETIYSARKKCPNLQVFPPNPKLYRISSDLLYNYLSKFTPIIERFSIDECFLDMSNTNHLYKDLIALAHQMKEEIKQHFGFTVNIGIANNKLCAKMASDFEKPDKVHTLFIEEVKTKMWPLDVQDLFMVGKKSVLKLRELGIHTIEDLAKADQNLLKHYFKSASIMMHNYANGIDDSPINYKEEKNKCISVSETLPIDIDDKIELKKVLLRQAEEVGRNLRKQNLYTKTIAITLRTNEFINYSHQTKLLNQTNITEVIYKTAVELLEKSWNKEPIRNIGIRLSDFVETNEKQLSLFDKEEENNDDKIQIVVDNIKDKYGVKSIIPASLLEKNRISKKGKYKK